MYLPLASVAQQNGAHAIYWREMVTEGGGAEFLMNDAYAAPTIEMASPARACHYPLTDSGTGTASETIAGASGSYASTAVTSDGPAVAVDMKYGRGVGFDNPGCLRVLPLAPNSMTTPTPSASNTNPIGLTSSTFTLACWYRLNDTTTSFDASGDSGGKTTATIIGLQQHGTDYSTKGWYCRLNLQRRKDGSYDPGYWLQAEVGDETTMPAAGSGEVTIETDPSQTPWDAAMQNTLWHYVCLVVDPGFMRMYIDGELVASRGSTSSAPFPTTPRLALSVNTTIGVASPNSIRKAQFAHAQVYSSALTQKDMQRHFNSMRRPLDMKVNYAENRYTTAQVDHIGSLTPTDLDYSPTSHQAQHRHDGRWCHMIRLDNPLYDESDSDLDDHLEDCQMPVPRHWELTNQAGDAVSDPDQKYRFNTHVAAGGFDLNSGITHPENGVTILTGWEGINSPRSGSYGIGQTDSTVIVDWKGTGTTGGAGINMTWSYGIGTAGSTSASVVHGNDGPDGFALYRAGTVGGDGTPNQFKFYTPWESGGSTGNTFTQTASTSTAAGQNWQYQAIAVTGDKSSLSLHVLNPARLASTNETTTTLAASYQGNTGVSCDRMVRNQVPARPRMLYCNRDTDANPLTAPAQGNSGCVDQNRYGPIVLIPDRVSDDEVKRMMRLMHGQPLMRTRPALRAPFRHVQCNAPTRSLT